MAAADLPPAAASRGGLELRLERGRAQLRFTGCEIVPGVTAAETVLEAPPGSPADAESGPGALRSRLCDLGRLELSVERPFARVAAAALEAASPRSGLAELRLELRDGFAELAGRIVGGPAFTARAALVARDGALELVVHEPRAYGSSPFPAAAVAPRLAAAAARALGGAASGAVAELAPVRPALLRLLPPRGYKLPRVAVKAASASISPDGARAAWSRGDPPPWREPEDGDLAAALDGARAFSAPERLLARGEFDDAREAWRALPPGARAHPFATARTLSLLVADPRFHAEARALARSTLARAPAFPAALLAEALLARARGEAGAASVAFGALAAAAAARGERFAAVAAADACAADADDAEPEALTVALEAALAADRTHLPALRALRALAQRTRQPEQMLRACRGLAAHEPDPAEKARAHLQLAELLAGTDPAAARLHRDNARRLGAGRARE